MRRQGRSSALISTSSHSEDLGGQDASLTPPSMDSPHLPRLRSLSLGDVMPMRTAHIVVRYSPAERSLLRDRAAAAHAPIARYIREASLGHTPLPKAITGTAELVRALNRVGLDLRRLVDGGDVATARQAEATLTELIDVLRTIGAASRRSGRLRTSSAASLEARP
jgi:hypothetical protein